MIVDRAKQIPHAVPAAFRAPGHGWWRRLVIIGGVLVACIIILGVMPRLDVLAVACDGDGCAPQQLTPYEASRLRDAGIGLQAYAFSVVALECLATVGWLGMAALLLAPRRSSPVTMLGAVVLIAFGATFSGFIDALAS